jgi:hypothetical protein
MAKYTIHPTGGYAVLDESERRRIEGTERGMGFTVRTSGTYLAGYGWGIDISLTGVNHGAPIKHLHDDDIAAGMARGEQIARDLIRDRIGPGDDEA